MKEIQIYNIAKYKKGNLLINYSRGRKKVEAFMWFGDMYISKNTKRSKKYSFDDKYWENKPLSVFRKLQMIWNGNYKVVTDCKKSRIVGV